MEGKIEFLQKLNREDINIILEDFQQLKERYEVAKALGKSVIDDLENMEMPKPFLTNIINTAQQYKALRNVLHKIYVHHNEQLKKERIVDKQIVQKVRQEFEQNASKKETSETTSEN